MTDPRTIEEVDDSVDTSALADWLVDQGFEVTGNCRLRKLSGGTQNRMFVMDLMGRKVVLRCGPTHPRPSSNEALRRELRVLTALSATDIPHARLVAACTDDATLGGTVFYVMEMVAGFNAAQRMPALHAASATVRHDMGLEMASVAAHLGEVDVTAAGLGDFGHPDGFLERQAGKWRAEFDRHRAHQGYEVPDLPNLEDLTSWLERNRPRRWTPGLLHGDFHIANMMFANDGPEITAVVDWEMSTIGDPLLDLGLLLAVWPADDQPEMGLRGGLYDSPDLANPSEIVSRYRETSTRDLDHLPWYAAMAAFKLAAILEGTYARSLVGLAPRDLGDRLHATAMRMLTRTRRFREIDSF